MQRSYSHVGKYPTQVQCFTDYGVLKREIIFQVSCRQVADSDAPGVKIRPDVVIQHIAVLVIGRNS